MQNVLSIKLHTKSNETINRINIPEDVVIADVFDEDGSGLLLPKGTYELANNQFEFIARRLDVTKVCYTRISNLTLFGVDMGSVITICIYIPTLNRVGNSANIKINGNLTADEVERISKNNYEITIANDIPINQLVDGMMINTIIKAGVYKCQEDGSIVLQNVRYKL